VELYKVAVDIDGREVTSTLKAGIVASMEVGSHEHRVERPENRISLIIGHTDREVIAWVQVIKHDGLRRLFVTHEGWIEEGSGVLNSTTGKESIKASLTVVTDPSAEMLACQERAALKPLDCCVAYGNGCYVRCCNACCADPTRCPGASCCG